VIEVPCNQGSCKALGAQLCDRCREIVALRALLMEALPSVEHHANKRRKGVEKFRQLGTPHDNAERRLSYLDNLAMRMHDATSQNSRWNSADPLPQIFFVPRQMLDAIYRTLKQYASEATYLPARTGGVLQGCPRGPAPTPSELAFSARMVLRMIDRDLLKRFTERR
jgi:hypothetical protein